MKHLAKWFMDLRIASKIVACYFVMLCIFLGLGAFTYRQFQALTVSKVRQMSSETTGSIRSNLDFLLDTLDRQSLILLSSQVLQSALETPPPGNSFLKQNQVCTYLADFMNFNDVISSIYLFDQNGIAYYVDSASPKNLNLSAIRKADWYPRLAALNGGFLLKLNGGGAYTAGPDAYVSLIRVINSLNTQKPIGVMVVNVSAKYIGRTVMQGSGAYNMRVILRDETDRDILGAPPEENGLGSVPDGGSVIRKIGGENYIVSTVVNRFGWKITSVTPFSELTKQVVTTNITLIVFIVVIGILFLAAFIFVSLLITKPIHKLAVSMKAAENGEFREIDIRTGNDEIGHLKDVYNLMVRKIVVLFDDIIREQAMKRKKELEVLQMQIKPHFLYNSFDSIASLALSGQNGEVYRLVQSLGKYYRGFLSACDEEVTIGRELEIVDSYLAIQEIRFPGKFAVERQIDEGTLGCRIPSLTLQPLVENAINHGIRGKPGKGVLTLRSVFEGDRVLLTVEDDGTGMDRETVLEIRAGRSDGVGLRATAERLRLCFNADGLLAVESEKGRGTRVTISLPACREAANGR